MCPTWTLSSWLRLPRRRRSKTVNSLPWLAKMENSTTSPTSINTICQRSPMARITSPQDLTVLRRRSLTLRVVSRCLSPMTSRSPHLAQGQPRMHQSSREAAPLIVPRTAAQSAANSKRSQTPSSTSSSEACSMTSSIARCQVSDTINKH